MALLVVFYTFRLPVDAEIGSTSFKLMAYTRSG